MRFRLGLLFLRIGARLVGPRDIDNALRLIVLAARSGWEP